MPKISFLVYIETRASMFDDTNAARANSNRVSPRYINIHREREREQRDSPQGKHTYIGTFAANRIYKCDSQKRVFPCRRRRRPLLQMQREFSTTERYCIAYIYWNQWKFQCQHSSLFFFIYMQRSVCRTFIYLNIYSFFVSKKKKRIKIRGHLYKLNREGAGFLSGWILLFSKCNRAQFAQQPLHPPLYIKYKGNKARERGRKSRLGKSAKRALNDIIDTKESRERVYSTQTREGAG